MKPLCQRVGSPVLQRGPHVTGQALDQGWSWVPSAEAEHIRNLDERKNSGYGDLKIKQIKNTDLMSEIETVSSFRDLLSDWGMLCNSHTDMPIKTDCVQWMQDLTSTVVHACAYVHIYVYIYIHIHTQAKSIFFKRSYAGHDILKVVTMCMPKASIHISACYRYILLIYECSP